MNLTALLENWGTVWAGVAALFAMITIFVDLRDKETHRITRFGKLMLLLLGLSILGASFGIVAQSDRSKKTQDEARQLLKDTRQSIVELSRVLQSLDQPDIFLSFMLSCVHGEYTDFCSSAQKQAKEAAGDKMLPGEGVGLPPGQFDWSKWPTFSTALRAVFTPLFEVAIFKTKEKFDRYAEGQGGTADLAFQVAVGSSNLWPMFAVLTDGFEILFNASFEKRRPTLVNTEIMSIPDLGNAVAVIRERNFLKALIPTQVVITTPKGQSIGGRFQVRGSNNNRFFIADLSVYR
jgi:hypothetical protein